MDSEHKNNDLEQKKDERDSEQEGYDSEEEKCDKEDNVFFFKRINGKQQYPRTLGQYNKCLKSINDYFTNNDNPFDFDLENNQLTSSIKGICLQITKINDDNDTHAYNFVCMECGSSQQLDGLKKEYFTNVNKFPYFLKKHFTGECLLKYWINPSIDAIEELYIMRVQTQYMSPIFFKETCCEILGFLAKGVTISYLFDLSDITYIKHISLQIKCLYEFNMVEIRK